MWSFFKKGPQKISSSGIFTPKGNEFIELEGDFLEKSINQVSEHLGYNYEMFSTYFSTENEDIYSVVFEQFTTNIIYVRTKKTVTKLSKNTVNKYLKDFDFDFIYSAYNVNDILKDGIENRSLSSEFLCRVLGLPEITNNGIANCEKFGLYLHFIDGLLVDFQSADGLNEWAKEWKNINPHFIEEYEKEAKRYWGNNTQKIIAEINIQADAYSDVPSALQNTYLSLHKNSFGNYNFFNLLIAHYDKQVSIDEFKSVNHGRFEVLKSSNDIKRLKVGKFIYEFSEDGNILDSYAVD